MKLNPEMVKLLKERLYQVENGRGVNILLEGNLMFCFGIVETPEHQKEYSFTFYDDIKDHKIKLLNWNPNLAYSGEHLFWIEGFKKMEDEK